MTKPESRSIKILICDDDANIRKSFQRLAQMIGGEKVTVLTAATREEALQILEDSGIIGVLTDLNMDTNAAPHAGEEIATKARKKTST